MPFLGLLDRQGREIVGAAGYHRLDTGEVAFKMSPPRVEGDDVTFVNVSMIKWPVAGDVWPPVYHVAVFAEVDDTLPSVVRPFVTVPQCLVRGCTLVMAPGQLTFGSKIIPPKEWYGGEDHVPSPPTSSVPLVPRTVQS